ncbi:XrtA system polysaccharide deacetylase [Tautonia rosea]|uniref:XrtA system polysaccharide deacetylase n=1 Tax=Tautonia rosea TaxID=2728037 RepID=UPI001474918D|nr:XrtA system polysaccharide deacetylase [Tautonia rosea]
MNDSNQVVDSTPAPFSFPPDSGTTPEPCVILSFDVEEHYRIEAASHLSFSPEVKAQYAARVGPVTRWILEQLGERDIKATFFIVGELAKNDPGLVRDIHSAGHEVASHGWDHRRILAMTPGEFREDLRCSVDLLQQITGEAVCGYRAPTFSVVQHTTWAIDILAESGLLYDSSIYPVCHDRYGIPDAPCSPFLVEGPGGGRILELPPATLRIGGMNLPVGGGGYFRLLPTLFLKWGIRQSFRHGDPAVATLYFHPWEFDPGQPRLPLQGLSHVRTYSGIRRGRRRLVALLDEGHFGRAADIARRIDGAKCSTYPRTLSSEIVLNYQ